MEGDKKIVKRRIYRSEDGVFLTVQQAAERLNLGIETVRKISGEAEATIRIGRACRVDFEKLVNFVRREYGM